MPADRWLAPNQNRLKWEIVKQVQFLGYVPEIFSNSIMYIKKSIASPRAWSADAAFEVAGKCVGAVIIGLPRWTAEINGETLRFASDFCQYEGALFKSLQLPILIVAQTDLYKRGVFDYSFGSTIAEFKDNDDETWVTNPDFMNVFDYWKNKMYARRDVFLGYCSSSSSTAKEVKYFLENELHVSVMDWQTDFTPGNSILQQIQEATEKCATGIFLFTKDDFLKDNSKDKKALPRDNVVFEAGYFIKAKGKSHVLVILEKGAKMPADLGGDIYASLENTKDINTIREDISKFVNKF
jgi:hypothetical protein